MENLVLKYKTVFKKKLILCILMFPGLFLLKNSNSYAGWFNPGVHPWSIQTGKVVEPKITSYSIVVALPLHKDLPVDYSFEDFFFPFEDFSGNIGLGKGWQYNLDFGFLLAPYPNISFTKQIFSEGVLNPNLSLTGGLGWLPFHIDGCVFTTVGIGKTLPFSILFFLPSVNKANGRDLAFCSLTAGYTATSYALSGEPWYGTKTTFNASGIYYEIVLGLDILMLEEQKEKGINRHFIRIGAKKEFYPDGFYIEGTPFFQSHTPLDFFAGYRYEGI